MSTIQPTKINLRTKKSTNKLVQIISLFASASVRVLRIERRYRPFPFPSYAVRSLACALTLMAEGEKEGGRKEGETGAYSNLKRAALP